MYIYIHIHARINQNQASTMTRRPSSKFLEKSSIEKTLLQKSATFHERINLWNIYLEMEARTARSIVT